MLEITVALRLNASEEDVLAFPQVLSVETSSVSRTFLPGISKVAPVAVGAHKGYSISFHPSATPAERSLVLRRVREARIVCEAFTNVYPEELALDTRLPCDT